MKLLDVLTSPWAIEPAKLLEIKAIYATHLRGEKIDIGAVEKRLGRPLDNQPKCYDVQDGVAIICLDGVIAKRMNMFSQISGGTSAELVGRNIQDACADPAVHSIILSVDSPGGTVDGTQTLADIVAGCCKPIVTLASGTMCSAAYWVGSAANACYITDSTTQVGSIGVVATHTDVSGQQAAQGVKTTEIYAGAYKRIASSYAPLTKEGKQNIQDSVDYTYGLFVDAVAKNRKCTADVVLKNMADGRIFIGQQAIDAGLVDGVSTMAELIARLNANPATGLSQPGATRAGAAHIPPQSTKGAAMPITREQLAAEAPDVLAAIRQEGATAERERIQAIEATAIPGHEALISALKFDGKSTAGDAALAVLAAEKQSRQAQASALASDAPAPIPLKPVSTVEASTQPATRADLDAKAKAYMAANPGTDYVAAIKHVQGA
jgi:signal peptide peptidase SppA